MVVHVQISSNLIVHAREGAMNTITGQFRWRISHGFALHAPLELRGYILARTTFYISVTVSWYICTRDICH